MTDARRRAAFDVVVFGASAGGLRILSDLLARLPGDFPAACVVVQHAAPGASLLPALLQRRSAMLVREAAEGDRLDAGVVYVAPNGRHTAITADRRVTLTSGAKVANVRPAADVLFASAAATYGARAIAVVLTGRLRDGSAGVRAIKRAGGRVLVQEPLTAAEPSMPIEAIATGCADFILPVHILSCALIALVSVPGAAELLRVMPPPWALLSP